MYNGEKITAEEVIAISQLPFTGIVQTLPDTVPFTAPEQMERQSGQKTILRLGANESPFGMSPQAMQAMAASLREAMWYGDPESYDLRKELERRFGFAMGRTVIDSGIDALLGLLVRVFVEPGQSVVTSKGAYPTFLYHVAGYGGLQHLVPYLSYLNDLDKLAATAREVKAKMVYLANPDNPTGTYYTALEIAEFLRDLPADCLFLLDEAYVEFAPGDIHLPPETDDARLVRLRTFSKVHGLAGCRIGYAVAHPDIVKAMNKTRNHFGVNRMAQAGALASLHDAGFVTRVVQETAKGRQEYYDLAAELGFHALESATNFVAVDVGDAERAGALVNDLWRSGIFVRSPGTEPLNRLVRITVGTPEQRQKLATTLRGICRGNRKEG